MDGELVYELPSLDDIRGTKRHVNSLYSEYRRDMNHKSIQWIHRKRQDVDELDQTTEYVDG